MIRTPENFRERLEHAKEYYDYQTNIMKVSTTGKKCIPFKKTTWECFYKVLREKIWKYIEEKNFVKNDTRIFEPSTMASEFNNYLKNTPVGIIDNLKKNINVSTNKIAMNEKTIWKRNNAYFDREIKK